MPRSIACAPVVTETTDDSAVRGFAPILGRRPRVLILGSMPSEASLAARQYYGHPRNAFWWIMGQLVGAGPDLPYEQRAQRLRDAGIALWDVLESCRRHGSLDAAIERASERPNDVPALLRREPQIRAVFLNGGAAEALFRRHHRAQLVQLGRTLRVRRLPSTSPAHAARSARDKLAAWRLVAEVLNEET